MVAVDRVRDHKCAVDRVRDLVDLTGAIPGGCPNFGQTGVDLLQVVCACHLEA